MRLRRSLALSLLAAALCASTVHAQDIDLSTDVAKPGDSVVITYTNRNMAGKIVQIEVCNGDPVEPVTLVYEITLNAAGEGKFTWIVQAWAWAEVSAPDARDATIFIR